MVLHTKYQGPVVSDKKSFSCFPYISLCKKNMNPGVGPFLAPGAEIEQTW